MLKSLNWPYDTDAVAAGNARLADTLHTIGMIPLMILGVIIVVSIAIGIERAAAANTRVTRAGRAR